MSDRVSEIERGVADVLGRMASTSARAPDLTLHAATPLTTLPPELVALVVGRVQAGATAFGADHPRAAILKRMVVPSAVLAVVDAIGLIVAAATAHVVLAVVTAILLIVLAYLAFAGVRFVRTDPLRVSPEQRAYVEAAKTWQSQQAWTDDLRAGPWGRLVGAACDATRRIAASESWTWASTAVQRADTELAPTLDGIDAAAFALGANHEPVPTPDAPGAEPVRRVAALHCYAEALDDLVRRAVRGADLRSELPRSEAERLEDLLVVVRAQ